MIRKTMAVVLVCVFGLAVLGQEADERGDFERGLAMLGTEDHYEGVDLIDRAIDGWVDELAESPDSPFLAFKIGGAHQILGRAEAAAYSFEMAVRLAPSNGDYRYAWSLALEASGDDAGALEQLEKAVEFEPSNARYLVSLAFGLRGSDPDRAAGLYVKVGELEGAGVADLFGAGTGLGELDRGEESEAVFDRLVGVEAGSGIEHRIKATVLLMRDDEAGALKEYVAWAELEPDGFEPKIKMMEMYDRLNQRAKWVGARRDLYALRDSGRNAELSAMPSYVIQRMNAEDHYVLAEEWFELSGTWGDPLVAFTLYENETGEPIQRVSLGSYDDTTESMRRGGDIGRDERIYHLDRYMRDGSHETHGFFKSVPRYEVLRARALAIFNGEVRPISATRVLNGRVVVEQNGEVIQEQAIPPVAVIQQVPSLPWVRE